MSTQPEPFDFTEDDFASIGEVIVHAATLENLLVVLASISLWLARSEAGFEQDAIRNAIRSELLGSQVTILLKTCQDQSPLLERFATAEYLQGLWADCAELLEHRNAVAHSDWQARPDGRVETVRALPKHKREGGTDFIKVGVTLDQMQELNDQLADAIRDMKDLVVQAWPHDWPETADVRLRPPREGAATRPRKQPTGSA